MRFITSRIVLVLELISDVLGITLHHWPARGVNYSRAELHYISRPVGELINNSITSPLAPPLPPAPLLPYFQLPISSSLFPVPYFQLPISSSLIPAPYFQLPISSSLFPAP